MYLLLLLLLIFLPPPPPPSPPLNQAKASSTGVGHDGMERYKSPDSRPSDVQQDGASYIIRGPCKGGITNKLQTLKKNSLHECSHELSRVEQSTYLHTHHTCSGHGLEIFIVAA